MIDYSKEEHKQTILEFLEQRKSSIKMETINSSSFILCNKYDDIWPQELDFTIEFQKEI